MSVYHDFTYTENDTIAAVSTPKGTGAVSVIRISGDGAFNTAEALFCPAQKTREIKDRQMTLGIIQYAGEKIDEVLLTRFRSPGSFTGEDMVEISCHGGMYITARIFELITAHGARAAEPGEFTKRAFFNGKLDLIQAQAVQELVAAKSKKAGEMALRSLKGELSEKITEIKDRITDELARMAVSIDYPEYDEAEHDISRTQAVIKELSYNIKKLIDTYKRGCLYNDGVRIAIVGRPNVGKSTFLNTFTGKNRAIVTDIPGTTRDTIEEYLEIEGIPVVLTDTAGLRDTDDQIEKIGQEKTIETLERADIILLILDSNEGYFNREDEILRKYIDKHIILVLNKTDKTDEGRLTDLEKEIPHGHIIRASLINKEGVRQIEAVIQKVIEDEIKGQQEDIVITQQTQKELLSQADNALMNAYKEIEANMPVDIAEIEIRNAAAALGRLLGDEIDEEITNKIFSKFCLGK